MTAIRISILLVLGLIPTVAAIGWVSAAKGRVEPVTAAKGAETAVASAADEAYCTPELKRVLRRVLQSCGLLGAETARGCQPVDAKNVATMSDGDFNALFLPMSERAGIIQFDQGEGELDEAAKQLVDQVFADRRGASYFFVVARASPEGSVEINRKLSKQRAEAVMSYLGTTFADPSLEREVGLLWLGKEYAQLDRDFCDWRRSRDGACGPEHINRSAFIAWIDCRL